MLRTICLVVVAVPIKDREPGRLALGHEPSYLGGSPPGREKAK
jgi:hypothetical protein